MLTAEISPHEISMPPTLHGAVVSYDFTVHLDTPHLRPFLVALVSRCGVRPVSLAGIDSQLIREPHEIGPHHTVVLFHGAGMAQCLKRFSAETEGGLPPVAVLAPCLDWDDVSLALDQGATSYLLENSYSCLLAEALLCTARGVSMLDPAVAAEQVRAACRARADERERARTPARPEEASGSDRLETVVLPDRFRQLSRRERQVMELLVAGQGIHDIAGAMFLTDKTVRNYLSRIYAKLGVRCRSEAILCWLGRLYRPGATAPVRHRKRDGPQVARDTDR